MSGTDEARPGQAAGPRTSTAEWIVAAVGALVVAFTLAYLAYDAIVRPSLPPDIRVRPGAITAASGEFIVQFRARNIGGATAARVQVVGELVQGGAVVEQHQATLQYVPARSEREGGLFFTRDPRHGRLLLRAEGYSSP